MFKCITLRSLTSVFHYFSTSDCCPMLWFLKRGGKVQDHCREDDDDDEEGGEEEEAIVEEGEDEKKKKQQ